MLARDLRFRWHGIPSFHSRSLRFLRSSFAFFHDISISLFSQINFILFWTRRSHLPEQQHRQPVKCPVLPLIGSRLLDVQIRSDRVRRAAPVGVLVTVKDLKAVTLVHCQLLPCRAESSGTLIVSLSISSPSFLIFAHKRNKNHRLSD